MILQTQQHFLAREIKLKNMKAAIFMDMKQMDSEKCLVFIHPTFTTHKVVEPRSEFLK